MTIFKASALWANAFYKSKCPSVCLFVCLFTFEVPFKHLLAPTSKSRMSKIFRILGEKSWKQVISDVKTFTHKGCKIAAQKKKMQI